MHNNRKKEKPSEHEHIQYLVSADTYRLIFVITCFLFTDLGPKFGLFAVINNNNNNNNNNEEKLK